MTTDDFWNAVKLYVAQETTRRQSTDPVQRDLASLQGKDANIRALRKVVLNPLSHSVAAAITKAEIQDTINLVKDISLLLPKV